MAGGEDVLEDDVVDAPVGLVLALALLVLYHPALLVEPFLVDHAEQVPHAVRLHPQGEVQGVGRDDLEVVGAVGVRGAVHAGGAHAFERLEELAGIVLGAVEHQVFEKMGETRLAGFLVLRADVVPDVDGGHRRLRVLVDDQGQAVRECVLREGDVDGRRPGFGRLGRVCREAKRTRSEQQDDGPAPKGSGTGGERARCFGTGVFGHARLRQAR